MISFIVPVYNMESSLQACVDSLLAQECELEVILVDDGSKDASPALCDELATRDPRIVVIHQKNAGLSGARNTGLANVNGDYVWFVDSDDWLDKNAATFMLAAAEASNADIVVCGMSNDYVDNGYSFFTKSNAPGVYCGWEEIARAIQILDNEQLFAFATNKLYRLDFLKQSHAMFENTRLPVEDILFNLSIIRNVKCIAIEDIAPYHYMQYNNLSMVRRYSDGLYEICQRINTKRRAMYRDLCMTGEEQLKSCAYACFRQDFHAITNMYRHSAENIRRKRLETWRSILNNGDIREEVRLCVGRAPEAKLLRFAMALKSPRAANAFFTLVMGARKRMGPVYRVIRDKILLPGRTAK